MLFKHSLYIFSECILNSGEHDGTSEFHDDESEAESEPEVDEGDRLLNELREILRNDTEDTDDEETERFGYEGDHDAEVDANSDDEVAYTVQESTPEVDANMVAIHNVLDNDQEEKRNLHEGETYFIEGEEPEPDSGLVLDTKIIVDTELLRVSEQLRVNEQLRVSEQLPDTNHLMDTGHGTDNTRTADSETVAATEHNGQAEANTCTRNGPIKVCKQCQYIATSSIDLRRHMHKAHYFAPVECNICQKVLPNKYARGKHMETDHGVMLKKKGRKNNSVTKPKDTRTVDEHVATDLNSAAADCNGSSVPKDNSSGLPQTISPQHKCDKCQFSGKNRRSLMMHKRHVHNPVSYKCGLCKYSSNIRSKVAKHTAQEHKQEDWMELVTRGNVE